jgi:hypothetical protein
VQARLIHCFAVYVCVCVQLRMMETELNALASSNQQLRSQLEISAEQV